MYYKIGYGHLAIKPEMKKSGETEGIIPCSLFSKASLWMNERTGKLAKLTSAGSYQGNCSEYYKGSGNLLTKNKIPITNHHL